MASAVATNDYGVGYKITNRVGTTDEELTLAGKWKWDFTHSDTSFNSPFNPNFKGYISYALTGNANADYVRAYFFDFGGTRSVYKIEYLDGGFNGKVVLTVDGFDSINKTATEWVNGEIENIFFDINNSGNDYLSGNDLADSLVGGKGEDYLEGKDGNDNLLGGASADTIDGGDGSDNIDGGTGVATDVLILQGFKSDYVFEGDAQNFTATGKGNTDAIKNIESIQFDNEKVSTNDLPFKVEPPKPTLIEGDGTSEPLDGNELDNEIFGKGGSDTITGGLGNDEIHGGIGRDRLTGNEDFDTFFFDTRPNAKSNRDVITDFNRVNDTIALENAYFSKLGGAVAKNELVSGTKAKDKNDYLIYDTKTGNLYYDPDGNGSKAKIWFATLENKAKITAADFDIV